MTYPPGAYTMHYQQPGAQQQPLSQSAQFTTTPTVNPHTGQPDYSAQWAEYYRSIGMHDQATAIENHLRINAASATALQSFAQSVQPSQQITYDVCAPKSASVSAQSSFGYSAVHTQPQTAYQYPQHY
ncbi:unnamed protein product [Toxocara canis]|uniref:DUF1897 domain-containing protein n=1 Tax=Toxocara canis TaxID=6265 RepID=A0A183V4E7_TOXCA|nr:unnamed protein product [Toxocara canis]